MSERRTYVVSAMHCEHYSRAVSDEVAGLPGVEAVVVDLVTKHVDVTGYQLDDGAIRAAIMEAGYEAD